MNLSKMFLVMMVSVSCSILMFEPPTSAEQGATKEAEDSQSTPAGASCCHMKGAHAAEQAQNGKSQSCCDHQNGSHGAHAGADCCHMKGAHASGHAPSGTGQSCCASHENSHGKENREEGKHHSQ